MLTVKIQVHSQALKYTSQDILSYQLQGVASVQVRLLAGSRASHQSVHVEDTAARSEVMGRLRWSTMDH